MAYLEPPCSPARSSTRWRCAWACSARRRCRCRAEAAARLSRSRSSRWTTPAARYVVSTRGESDWVRNARRSGYVELRERGRSQRFAAVEVAVAERGSIIDAYRAKAGRTRRDVLEAAPRRRRPPDLPPRSARRELTPRGGRGLLRPRGAGVRPTRYS